jgi:hypothetical protein
VHELQATAHALALESCRRKSRAEDVAPAFEALKGALAPVLLATRCNDPRVRSYHGARRALPTILQYRGVRRSGRSDVLDLTFDLFRRAADFVDKIRAARSRAKFQSSSRPSSISST